MKNKLTPEERLINIVNTHFESDIRDRSRQRNIVDGRGVFFKILYDEGYSKSTLGKIFNMNHATVIHSLKGIGDLMRYDRLLRLKYNECKQSFLDEFNPIFLLKEDELRSRLSLLEKENDALKSRNIYLHSLIEKEEGVKSNGLHN